MFYETQENDKFRGGNVKAILTQDDKDIILKYCAVEVAVELGTYLGGGTELISSKAKRVYTIDLFEGIEGIGDGHSRTHYEKKYGEEPHSFSSVSESLSVYDNITVIKGRTDIVPDGIPGVDFLFIDADHSFTGVMRDFCAWYDKIVPNGLIAFHDYGHGWKGVTRFIDEVVSQVLPLVAGGGSTRIYKKTTDSLTSFKMGATR